jgi:hypothetical protein
MEFSNSHNINFGSVSGAYSKINGVRAEFTLTPFIL